MTRLVLDGMKEVAELAHGLGFMQGHARVSAMSDDSREVRAGDVFICMPRAGQRAAAHVNDALKRGAACVVFVGHDELGCDAPALYLPDMRALAAFLERALDLQGRRPQLAGITGTDGKTSVCWMLRQALSRLGCRAWGMGTLGLVRDERDIDDLGNTTPSLLSIHDVLRRAAHQGVDWLVMEVSSHGIAQQRIAGLSFSAVIWTGMGSDHIEDHGGLAAYRDTKAGFVRDAVSMGAKAVVNGDDAQICEALAGVRGLCWYARSGSGRQALVGWEQPEPGTLRLKTGGRILDVAIPFGEFHAENAAAVACFLRCVLELPVERLPALLDGMSAPPGRMQRIDGPHRVFVDYAHTPEALERCLLSARQMAARRLLLVFGCGGERDREKRPRMGHVAATLADEVWITSDNPRGEPPLRIIEDIAAGVPEEMLHQVHRVADREQALAEAVSVLAAGDVLVVAGKGHETYMDIDGKRLPWRDDEVLMRLLARKDSEAA